MNDTIQKFIDEISVGTLATTRPNGGIRQSVVYYVRDSDRILISTESKRAKARDVERTGWASLCVQGPEKPFPSVTVEGKARIVRENIGAPTARILERISGTPSPAVTDADLGTVDRVILEMTIDHTYGASHL